MRYEVEIKFRLTDPARLEDQIAAQGWVWGDVLVQRDTFFQHPSRDFAQTDEGLRIRVESCAAHDVSAAHLTYKGAKMDATTKTRREIDLPISGDIAPWTELFVAIGFTPIATICKERTEVTWSDAGRLWTLTRDRLLPSSLGAGATTVRVVPRVSESLFCELETVTDEGDVHAARQSLLEIAASLGLTDSVRTSYLELFTEMKDAP